MLFQTFTALEKRNLFFYIIGIMLYKFALETMNACMSGIVLNRLPVLDKSIRNVGTIWTVVQGINYFSQCLGSLLIGPLVKRNPPARILSATILAFGFVMLLVSVLEASTGGRVPGSSGSKSAPSWGNWHPLLVFLFFTLSGVFHGMTELMRRVIPNEIVGGDATKLREMDSLVHICYEVTGTIGALLSVYWISYFGWGYAVLIMPICFVLAAGAWSMLKERPDSTAARSRKDLKKLSIMDVSFFFKSFLHSVSLGAKLVFGQRALIWLVPAYTLPLVLHRYLENTLFPFYAKGVLKNSDLQNILTAGSNFGELLGAFAVLIFARAIETPIPFLRADAILLLLVWVLPFINLSNTGLDGMGLAWRLFPMMSAISFGWASGDVSLAAYIQSRLSDQENTSQTTSPLAAVMSFLYVTYLGTFFILNTCMGLVRDEFEKRSDYQGLFIWIGGVFMTASAVIVFFSTFIPRGSFAWNPTAETVGEKDIEQEDQVHAHDLNPIHDKNEKEDMNEMMLWLAN